MPCDWRHGAIFSAGNEFPLSLLRALPRQTGRSGCSALHIVERAARKRQLSREATLFRIDLYARLRGIEAACALTLSQLGKLRLEDAERVLQYAHHAGKSRAALALARALGQALPATG